MGIKTTITHADLPYKYRHLQLIPTVNGITESVYLLSHLYVLKIFENIISYSTIENETALLSALDGFPVPKVVDQFTINTHPAIVYTQIPGTSIVKPGTRHIKEIALFLKAFHAKSQHIKLPLQREKYSGISFQTMIDTIQDPLIDHYFHTIDISLKNEGIIHGDLFPDNCKFNKGRLSGVFDFSDSAFGDFHFDLAVVAVGWCFEDTTLCTRKVSLLLKYYGSPLDMTAFKTYIRYALLYYATTRYISNQNYTELLQRLKGIL